MSGRSMMSKDAQKVTVKPQKLQEIVILKLLTRREEPITTGSLVLEAKCQRACFDNSTRDFIDREVIYSFVYWFDNLLSTIKM